HKHGVKVILSLGGWGWDKQFASIVDKPATLDRYVTSVLKIIDEYDYDGIDLDWEYPDSAREIPGFERLVLRFRQELDSLGRKKGRAMVQTMAVSSNPGTLRWLKKEVLLETMDWLNVMTYDYAGTWTPYAGHNSPLFASSRQPGDTARSTELSMKYLAKERGLPPDRLAVGIPLYGRGFAVSEPYASTRNAPAARPRAEGGNYSNIDRLLKQGWTRRWDDETKTPWLIAPDRSSVIGYDDAESVSLKTDWAMKQGFRGVFFWQIGGDLLPDGTNPLQEAAHKKWVENRQKRAEIGHLKPITPAAANPASGDYQFDGAISRPVLEHYLSRAITMEGLLNGRGDLTDNMRMLTHMGAKFIGRGLCLWGGEANLLRNLERARRQAPLLHQADPDLILQACVFEIVTNQVEQVPVPDWAFIALERPVEKRNFRYADMLYPDGRRRNQWGRNASVPDVSRPETKLWFYFLAASFLDLGIEAIHFGQAEIMNGNDPKLDHWSEVLTLVRAHAARHARRHMVLCDAHVPSGGLVRDGKLLLDFHSFPLRIKEVPDRPREAILEVGFADGIYGKSRGGLTPSGWKCEHLPYLVEIDNWGASRHPGRARAGGIWVWGYDEITWFAHQPTDYRNQWLRYAWNWVRHTDPCGWLEMPGGRTLASPLDGKRWYYANTPSSHVPEGYGQEDTIRAIWAEEGRKR
ncbi:MAG: glycoside hydrolase family 18 protein, partial [Isosphaeraceae bacterium]